MWQIKWVGIIAKRLTSSIFLAELQKLDKRTSSIQMSKWSWIVYLVSSQKWYMKHFRKYSSKIYEFSWTQDTLLCLIWSEVWITATSEVCSMAESSLSNFVEQLVRTYRYFQQEQFAICPEFNRIEKYDSCALFLLCFCPISFSKAEARLMNRA